MNAFEPLTRLLPASLRSLVSPRGRSKGAQRLARLLNVADSEIELIRLGPRHHYRPFTIAKRDGRERRILAPSPALKQLQRRLLHQYLGQLPVHFCATAFRVGLSIVQNASRHARQRLIASVDLRDFFESTRAGRVRAFFVKQGWRGDELQALMRLCVYRNALPQGAPTSPCLSNLVNVALDERLWQLAQRTGAIYTRYGDDLTFSWSTESVPGGFTQAVEDGLHAAGYEIQPCKGWRIIPVSERPRVTGLEIHGDGRVRVPASLRWRIWCLRWQAWWSRDEITLAKLQGYKGFVRMVK
jgi:hypothetical protein